jgi:addiction module HigA family antidote
MAKKLPPLHPGEILREEFLLPMQLTPYALAQACGVPRTRIERLAREETPVTADTALRLARYFGTSAEFWMNLQARAL